jgi:F0F1-type ATP synthase assembly protein I
LNVARQPDAIHRRTMSQTPEDERDPQGNKRDESSINTALSLSPMGIGTGIAIGAALGIVLDNIALGIGIGIAIGAGMSGAFIAASGGRGRKSEKEE